MDSVRSEVAYPWPRIEGRFDPPAMAGLGLILLAPDAASCFDVPAFLGSPDRPIYQARVPMSVETTVDSLRAMERHLTDAARTLVPGTDLGVIGFSCTSGAVAIGTAAVARAIRTGRDVPVVNPVDAAVQALRRLGVERVSLLVPYQDGPSALIEAYLLDHGLEVVRKASFKLPGDPQMNRLSANSLVEAGVELDRGSDAEALFISCTGLRTRYVIEPLERLLGKPVVSSNQALAWSLLGAIGAHRQLPDRGRLFSL